MVPMATLNRLRRDLVRSLVAQLERTPARCIDSRAARRFVEPIGRLDRTADSAKLAVLCRTLEQLTAACQSEADLVYADFHDIRQYREAVTIAAAHDVRIGLATVRMQKPGEMGLLRVLGRHRPDWILARNLAAIDHAVGESIPTIADFSLNVSNHRSAEWIRSHGG